MPRSFEYKLISMETETPTMPDKITVKMDGRFVASVWADGDIYWSSIFTRDNYITVKETLEFFATCKRIFTENSVVLDPAKW